MSVLPEAVDGRPALSPLDAFTGPIPRTKTRPLYSAGLAVVAFAMVLLPLLYLGLIFFTGWGVLWHLKHDTWMLEGRSGGFARALVYFGPVVAGVTLIAFMVKPFFAAKPRKLERITLSPEQEPLLFAFVRKVCGLVGAAAPCRIDVDCEVNASASLRRGLWSRDLVLTIGLPLVAGLDMRQFGGVLAHEFGHFAQGAGMRLTYIIRHINFWFARVVYERDAWDEKLEATAKNSDWRIAIVLHLARACVWLTRRILWVLMVAGNAISCFMLRQMEFDADSYEAKLAGSDAFALTAARLRVLNAATQTAYEDVRQSWASSRLPENLPLLIHHKAGSLPAETLQKLSSAAAEEKTGWFDTHPCDAERTRAARLLQQPGVFRLTAPATALFSNFAELSKQVTRHQYEKHLELEFTDQNLMSAEEIVRESTASAQADAMVRKYYGRVELSLKPLLGSGELPPPIAGHENRAGKWREARQATAALREAAEKLSAECGEQQQRLVELVTAHRLAKAGFRLEAAQFGLPEGTTSAGEQENAALFALGQASTAIAEKLTQLEPFMSALRQRVALALQAADALTNTSAEEAGERVALRRLLAAVAAEMPRAHDLGSKLKAFALLAMNRGNHSAPASVDKVITELAHELRLALAGLQERLSPFPYPFAHARGRLTVAEYARSEKVPDDELHRLYLDSSTHVERLLALHYRLLGRVLAQAEAGEQALEQQAY